MYVCLDTPQLSTGEGISYQRATYMTCKYYDALLVWWVSHQLTFVRSISNTETCWRPTQRMTPTSARRASQAMMILMSSGMLNVCEYPSISRMQPESQYTCRSPPPCSNPLSRVRSLSLRNFSCGEAHQPCSNYTIVSVCFSRVPTLATRSHPLPTTTTAHPNTVILLHEYVFSHIQTH